jgi:DNA-binding NtrC family response regulator
MARILCVDDEPAVLGMLEDTLERAGHTTFAARNAAEALAALTDQGADLIISDYKMPGITGLDLLSVLQRDGHDVPMIMLTGHASIEHAVAAIKAGAIDYITKPVRAQQVELAVEQALEVVRLRRENEALKQEVMGFRNERQIIGESSAMRRVLQTVTMAAATRATVLLEGESGTGKELVARALHDQSDRRDNAFVTLNCAAMPEGLIESSLFGHEKGAFTGAVRQVAGAFERAHRGTLLLDEISEMRLDLQAKLLRVLQEQEFERVGGTSPLRVDVRIIATTNRDLRAEATAGTFRQDLYYRLSVVPIWIPPLRERRSDIALLANRFALRSAAEMKKEIHGVSAAAIELLQAYEWPGNVRELQHAVERAVIMCDGPMLEPRHFQLAGAGRTSGSVTEAAALVAAAENPHGVVLDSLRVDEAEKKLIQRALEVTEGNRTQAAELLGISVRTLRNKLSQ